MSKNKKRNFNERMQALHEKYSQQLPAKYYEIEECWNKYQADLSNPDSIETFYRLIHTLKGTAATFGFAKQADLCFEVQNLLSSIIEDFSVLPENSVTQIQQLLSELKTHIDTPAENISE